MTSDDIDRLQEEPTVLSGNVRDLYRKARHTIDAWEPFRGWTVEFIEEVRGER